MTIDDPEMMDLEHGDYSKDEMVAAIAELRTRLQAARKKMIHEAFKPEIVDITKISHGTPFDDFEVLFYSMLGDARVWPDKFVRDDAKYPVLVLINGVQFSFTGALKLMRDQHSEMLDSAALHLVEEKLAGPFRALEEKLAEAHRVADRAVSDMMSLFPNARREER